MFSLTLGVVVVHSTCTSRTIWPMHNTNRRLGIVFKWASVVFIVCVLFTFFWSYILALAWTDPVLYKGICQIATGKVNTMHSWCALFYQSGKQKWSDSTKSCWSKDDVFLGCLDYCTTSVDRLRFPQLLFLWPLPQEHWRNMRCWDWTEAKVSRSDLPPWWSPPHLWNTF